jgi:hypothetical protein
MGLLLLPRISELGRVFASPHLFPGTQYQMSNTGERWDGSLNLARRVGDKHFGTMLGFELADEPGVPGNREVRV